MNTFNLDDFMKGKPVRTIGGKVVKFITLLQNGQPAPLVVDIYDKMENYFTDGKFLGGRSECEDDLIMGELF